MIICAYAQDIADGHSINGATNPTLKTIQNYVKSAADVATASRLHDPRHRGVNGSGKPLLIPGLDSLYSLVRKWSSPSGETQPLTELIFATLFHEGYIDNSFIYRRPPRYHLRRRRFRYFHRFPRI